MVTLGDIGVSAGINILSAVVFLIAFAILRIQPFNDRVYFPKWYLKGLRTSPTQSGAFAHKFVNLDWRSYVRFVNWMSAALKMPEPELIDHAGLDSAVYLRIYMLGCYKSSDTERGNSKDLLDNLVEITQKIRVDGEVNRARCMPQNPVLIGAKTSGCEVFVFDYSKQGSDCDPELRLRGHDKEGYGLSWSHFKEGYLISGSHDHKICLWDVSALTQDKVIDAMQVYQSHGSVVDDVSWHLKNENLFGSAGDDCQLIIWDVRTNQPQQAVKAHEKEINYLSFNPYNEWVLAAVVDERAYLECTSCSF